MSVNYWAVLLASVAEFIVGGIWYMPIFGKLWGEIHDFKDMKGPAKKAAQKAMAPMLLVQFIVTVVTTIVLAKFIVLLPTHSAYALASMLWIGFVVPTQISAVVFGGTKPKWIVTKTLIMASASIICLMVATVVLKNVH